METKMWGFKFCFVLAAMCSVLSADPIDDAAPFLEITTQPKPFYYVGEQKAIFCRARNIADEINWYSPNGTLVPNRTNDSVRHVERKADKGYTSAFLVIHSIKKEDHGTWSCTAGDHSVTFNFTVREKANILKRTEQKLGDETKSIKMTCEATGDPVPIITWYRGSRPINAKKSNGKYVVKEKDHVNTLEIKNLSYEDAGEYVCMATQKMLSHFLDKTVFLTVRHAPVLLTAETQETYGILNEIKNLTCAAQAFPPPSYKWIRSKNSFDSEIVGDDTVFTSEDGSESVLSLKLRTEDDLGQYKCKISNNKGSKIVLFDISLGSKPPTPDSVTFLTSNDSSLVFNVSCAECNFNSEPEFSADPMNLTVIAFQFQVTPYEQGYLPDWDKAQESLLNTTEDNIYVVSGLPNSTEFHVRVRSLNDAGYSDWYNVTGNPSTTAFGTRVIATITTVALLILNIIFLTVL